MRLKDEPARMKLAIEEAARFVYFPNGCLDQGTAEIVVYTKQGTLIGGLVWNDENLDELFKFVEDIKRARGFKEPGVVS